MQMELAELGISKDVQYFLFWLFFGLFALANFWGGVYFITSAIKQGCRAQEQQTGAKH